MAFGFFSYHSGELMLQDRLQSGDVPGMHKWVQNQDANGNYDGTWHLQMRLYNNTGGAMVAGQPYVMAPTGVQATNSALVTPAALAAVPRRYAIAAEAVPTASWGWFRLAGYVDANITGAQTIGQFLKIAPGTSTTALVTDGATQTTGSIGVVVTTRASSTGIDRCFLFGEQAVIN